jgi:hypothetical protein
LRFEILSFCLLLFCETGFFTQATKPSSATSDVPAATGVYYRRGDEGWIKLERAVFADTKARGLDRYLETDGWTRLSTTLVFHGAQSAIQIHERKPTFYVREIGSVADAIIVQLATKRDRREVQISSTDAGVHNLVGFKRGEIHQASATPLSKALFTVMSEEELKPGEYLLVLGQIDTLFDFGVKPAQK